MSKQELGSGRTSLHHSEACSGPGQLPSLDASDLASVTAAAMPIVTGHEPVAAIPRFALPLYRPINRLAVLHSQGRQKWIAVPDNMRGSILFILSVVMFCIMMVAIKKIGDGLPLPQILLIRQVILTMILLPLLLGDLSRALSTQYLGRHIVRGLVCLGSQYTYFLALLYLPLADMTALGFSQVIFMTIAAVVILKEKVGWRRWLATMVGFAGVLIMLRPSGGTVDVYSLVAVLSALLLCGVTVSIRLMARTESTETVMLYQSFVLCAAYAVPTFLWWQWPTREEWVLLAVIGIVGTLGQYLFTLAFRVAEASALAPLEFTRLLIAIILGFLVFSEIPEMSTMLGAVIVMGSTIYTVRRNSRPENADRANALNRSGP
ncbi:MULTISPECIES: DMT family transporter [Rhizobium/Agrobacterium group]|uniref:DMT family transporter n=1 Tax=Rhizobium/Agrobacterium group TaxID=227290 RepID=UPI00083D5755|nr:DMT family transporter [Agrobacterium sp. RAC06]AOG11891.1 eamA-like transporter family protein [Agrobacterium sp. RAC06]MDM8016386.1 DMT family transporter [Rhizobium sp.]